MRVFNKTVILIAIAVSVAACGGNENANNENVETSEVSSGEVQVVDYAVEGMVCAMGCAATIQKDVAGMEGVIVADVDYEAEKAHFEFDPAITSEEEIKAKIATIADGQYKLSTWTEKEAATEEVVTEGEETEVEDESLVKVSLPSFEIPNLFTLLLNQL